MDSSPSVGYFESAEKPVDYKYYLYLIKRSISLIITFLVMGATLASIYASRLPDQYQAATQILLERPMMGPMQQAQFIASSFGEDDYYNTQKEIMLGTTVLRQVVDELNLVDYFHTSNVDEAAKALMGSLQVVRVRGSRLFNIVATSTDAQFCAALSNAVARSYIRKNFEDMLYFSKEVTSWIPEEGQDTVTVEDPFGKVKQVSREELLKTLPSIVTDPTIRGLTEKKSIYETELTTLLKQFREKHPYIVKTKASLRFIEESLDAERQRVLETIKQQSQGKLQASSARIVEEAKAPKWPIGPDRSKMVRFTVGVEAVVILLFIFLWDYFDDTVRSPDDLMRKGITVPFLGPIPLVREFDVPQEERFLISHYHRRSTISESFRYLRVAINFSAPAETLKNLVFTSSLPNEGKSFVAHNIAVSLAQDGNRTLLVDADLRKPIAQDVYQMENLSGLSNYLTSEIEIDSVIRETFIENLWVILSGPVSPNPAEILGSKRMTDLLERAKEKFDRIVIDAPPLTGIGDSLILGSLTTHVVFIIRAGKTPAEIIQKSKEILEKNGIRIVGAVLNQVDIDKERHSGFYKYYYQSYTRYYNPASSSKDSEKD